MRCGYCGKPLDQREDEENHNFRRRTCCDQKCASKLRETKKRRK